VQSAASPFLAPRLGLSCSAIGDDTRRGDADAPGSFPPNEPEIISSRQLHQQRATQTAIRERESRTSDYVTAARARFENDDVTDHVIQARRAMTSRTRSDGIIPVTSPTT